MSRQYNNIIKHLSEHFDILTSSEDYYKKEELERDFQFRCKEKKHINTLKTTSYINKRALFNKQKLPLKDFCQICVDEKEQDMNFDNYVNEVLDKTGHLLVSYDTKERDAVYICCNCNETRKTKLQSLLINKGNCPNCQNNKFRLPYEKLKQDVESHGFKLVTKSEEYTSNKQKLDVICKCGTPYQTYLVSIRQDKHCETNCKTVKYEETCMKKYNERNVMHIDETFYKCQETFATTKQFTLPETNRTISIQGTEDIVLMYILKNENKILKRIIKEDEIQQRNIPSFKYEFENKKYKYYPDFHISNTNIIIEAKTIETHNKQNVLKNYMKFKSVVNDGYNIIIIILDYQYQLYDIWYFLENGKEISVLKENGIDIDFQKKLSSKNKLNNIGQLCENINIDRYL